MSRGLLQRLADRALGLAQPLRPQRAMPLPSVSQAPTVHADESIAAPPTQADRDAQPTQAAAVRSAEAVTSMIKTPRLMASSALVPAPVAAAPSASRHTPQAVAHQPVGDKPSAAVIAPLVAPAAMPSMATLVPVAKPPQAMAQPLAHAESRLADPSWPAPLPLLPEQPAHAALPRSASDPHAPISQQRSARRTAAAERPTEVHVSIGRVELTALAPSASAARPARTREPSRSLADYLRPAGKGQS